MSYIAGPKENYTYDLKCKATLFRHQTQINEEKTMITLYSIFVTLLVLDIAACRWGATSSDGIESTEWKRRQDWSGFH
jgi:hypothetical protein